MDAAGAGEEKGKGNTPKEGMTCSLTLGHAVKSCMTVIWLQDGALSVHILLDSFAGAFVSAIVSLQ